MNDVHRRILGLGRRPGQSCRLPEWSHLAFSPRGQFISKAFSRTKSWNKIKLLYATSLRYRKILSEERTMFVYNNSLLWLVRAERKSIFPRMKILFSLSTTSSLQEIPTLLPCDGHVIYSVWFCVIWEELSSEDWKIHQLSGVIIDFHCCYFVVLFS